MTKETLFGLSLFPYLGFLWFMTRSGQTPRLALIGFYLLLVFVAVTIPAGLYAKMVYHAELANVDWLHGSAESFLTLSNVFVVLGFRQALLAVQAQKAVAVETDSVAVSASAVGEASRTGNLPFDPLNDPTHPTPLDPLSEAETL
jgi:Protein of unknown function (DUF3593)